jgi:peptidoglycan/xylan/chitin deacetylase (PgdA/CDA1 family)
MFVLSGRATCLMYHHIARGPATRSSRFRPNLELYVAEEEFERQIRYVAENYECLSIDDAVQALARGRLPRRSIVVTFDDGYRDNLLALPILARYNVPATIYITTGAVGRARTFWWDEHETILERLDTLQLSWRGTRRQWDLSSHALKQQAFADLNAMFKALPPPEQDELLAVLRDAARAAGSEPPYFDSEAMLSWEEVAALDREPLITIGAHTVDHFVMRQLGEEELHRQIRESRAELERRLGHPITHFAYPFGREEHADVREFAAVAREGFASAVTTRPGHWKASAMFALPRLSIDYSDTMDDFRWKLSGWYAVQQRMRRRAAAAIPVWS